MRTTTKRTYGVALLLGLVVSGPAWAAGGDKKVSLATMDLKPQGVEASVAQNLTDLVTNQLRELGLFQVTSSQDIRNMLQFQADKRTVGCESDVACLVEIGGALGVEYLVAGTVGKLGDTYLLSLRLIHIGEARVEGSASVSASGIGKEMIDEMGRAVRRLTRSLRRGKSGFVSVTANAEGAKVLLDGKLVGSTPLPLVKVPGGLHDIELEKTGFVTWAGEVDVTPGEQATVHALLVPSGSFVEEYRSRAVTRRAWAWGLAGLGVAAAAGSVTSYLLAGQEAEAAQSKMADLDAAPGDSKLRQEIAAHNDAGKTQYVLYWVLMAAAVGAAGGSAVLLLTGEDPDRYDILDATKQAGAGLSWSF